MIKYRSNECADSLLLYWKDTIIPWQIVEPLTKLAIAEQWAPVGKLSFYNDELGHMSIIDSPHHLAKVYRMALEEQVLDAE